jgi:adenylate cyclase
MQPQIHKTSFPSKKVVSHQLNRLLDSPEFKATPQQIALLKYVVSQTLAGKADRIKGYTVATEVFGRRDDFDQSIDPIVSIQSARLRLALDRYYETAGINDPIRIDVPKGGYVPIFNEQVPGDQPIAAEQAPAVGIMAAWPTVLVRPLSNLTADPDDDYLSIGLTAELAHALSHYREIRVLEALHRDQKSLPWETDIDFMMDGNVRRDPMGVKVTIRLCDERKGIQIWSGKYQGNLEAAKMISFQEDVAAEIAARVVGGNAVIPRHLSSESKNKVVHDLTTYEAMLRYWEYDTLRTRQSFMRAIRALEHAAGQEPNCGLIWSMIAAQYADNCGLESVDQPTPLEKAVEFACKGILLEPSNRCARTVLAYVRLLQNKLQEARCEAETAYNLCPNSLMVLDTIGWVTALAGEWERGVNYIKKAIQLNPYYRPWVHHALSLNWFRTGNYEKAYQETLNFMMPECHWDPLLKAAACGQLGKIEEGQSCVQALLTLKPDFAKRGRDLIERYVKFEDIVDRIIEGLGKLGMNIESE